jgi:hypothetical protein
VFLDDVEPTCFLPLVTLLHASIKLNTYFDTFRIGICVLVVLLSPAVLSAMQVFYHYDVEYDLCLSVRDVVFHPLRCDLTM